MKSKILLFGKGFIGQRIREEFRCPVSHRRIGKYEDILSEIKKHKPNVIINAIGYTGRTNVDECENNVDKTLFTNSFIPLLMAEAALRNNIKYVHISSGCIYHYDYAKQKAIHESRLPDFYELFYSRTKIYSENVLKQMAKRYSILIVRPRIPLDLKPHPRNLLDKLLKYKSIIDVPNSVTYIPDFIAALKHLIKINAQGIYNVVAKGALRYHQLLDAYKEHHPQYQYQIIPLRKLKLVRTNLVLSTQKLEKTGFRVRGIKTVIKHCIENYNTYTN